MLKRTLIYSAAALLFLLGMRLGTMAKERQKPAASGNSVPAYHAAPPRGHLAPTLPPRDFPQNPVAQHAYAAAAHINPILYQLPCYCHCDHELGHTSLLSCYQTRHAEECATCLMEDYYAYEQSRKGKTAAQIRQGIIRGDWKNVDISKWKTPLAAHRTAHGAPAN
jgi:Protein of unknown function with PCYCGC motif